MTTLSEEFQQHCDTRPDKWTLKWWAQQLDEIRRLYRGARHAIDLALAAHRDSLETIQEFGERIDAMEKAMAADRARIGELQSELTLQKDLNGVLSDRLTKLDGDKADRKKLEKFLEDNYVPKDAKGEAA